MRERNDLGDSGGCGGGASRRDREAGPALPEVRCTHSATAGEVGERRGTDVLGLQYVS